MKTKKYLSAAVLMLSAFTAMAAQRDSMTVVNAAAEVLNQSMQGTRQAPRHDRLVRLYGGTTVTVMGYKSGGFSIISNDDRLPLVIGYSSSQYDTSNEAFKWYLESMEREMTSALDNDMDVSVITPDTTLYSSYVLPLTKTKWNQTAPYNKKCSGAPTGCVATAMAQIIYYYKYPKKGHGWTDTGGHESLFKTEYDFDNMLLDYSGDYTKDEADAVALLMFDCGTSAGIGYMDSTSSGSTIEKAAAGLKKNLYYENVTVQKSFKFSQVKWMDMIFKELNDGHPVMCTGESNDCQRHAFVLDGYKSDGTIHVNWGWGGLDDGYFLLSTMRFCLFNKILTGFYPPVTSDGIENAVRGADADTARDIYNICGQKVSKSYKGIVIVNGKKYINR